VLDGRQIGGISVDTGGGAIFTTQMRVAIGSKSMILAARSGGEMHS